MASILEMGGTNPVDPNYLNGIMQMAAGPQYKPGDLSAAPPAPAPVVPKAAAPTSVMSMAQKKPAIPKQKSTRSTENDFASPEELTDLIAAVKKAMPDQAAAVQKLSDSYNSADRDAVNNSAPWVNSLASLSDQVTGGHMVKDMSFQTPQDISKQILAHQDEIAKRTNDSSKDIASILSTVMKNKTGSTVNLTGDFGAGGMGGQRGTPDDMFYRQLSSRLASNPTASKQLSIANQVTTGFDQLSLPTVTPQVFHEGMQTLRNATLSQGGTSGVTERATTFMDSLEKKFQNLEQQYGNSVSNIPQNDPQFVQLKSEMASAYDDIRSKHQALIGSLTSGWTPTMAARRPDLDEGVKNQIASYGGLLPDRQGLPQLAANSNIRAPLKIDPQIKGLADASKIDYETAAKIVAARKAKANGR